MSSSQFIFLLTGNPMFRSKVSSFSSQKRTNREHLRLLFLFPGGLSLLDLMFDTSDPAVRLVLVKSGCIWFVLHMCKGLGEPHMAG